MGTAELLTGTDFTERLHALGERVPALRRAELRAAIAQIIPEVRARAPGPGDLETVIALCRTLYHHARSAEALSLARVALEEARRAGKPALLRRAASACGIIAADTLDLVGAVEYHMVALRSATEAGDVVEASRVWNNLGLAMGISGHYELAARCHRRVIELVAPVPEPLHSRYAAWSNLAHCLYRVGAPLEGLPYAFLALEEETERLREEDLHAPLHLRRNLVRLLVGCGRAAEAERHVAECAVFAQRLQNPRAMIALATALGTFELSQGKTDLALTRLENALARARELPAALHDTLVTVIRAEEAAGNVERALIRLDELTEHVYRVAVERARDHVELSGLDPANAMGVEVLQRQAKARLTAITAPPALPEAWAPLDRLAVNAALRIDATGWHGKRVGTLVKGLVLASGGEPLQALEMGHAAELHDIGMLSMPAHEIGPRDSPDDAARGILRRHVDAGVEMLRDDRHPRVFVAREIAQYHHARWDGEGHPGVGGRRIPLAARACAIADAYDEMLCGYGSGKPRSMDEALGEIRAEGGGRFDPELVDCFDRFIRAESEDIGVDCATSPGMEGFTSLVHSLREDKGFV